MAVAAALRAAFDGRVERDRVRPRIALAGIIETDRHGRLAARHHQVGKTNRATIIETCAKIGMQMAGQPDSGYITGGIGGYGQMRNVIVPDVIGWKNRAAAYRIRVVAALGPDYVMVQHTIRQAETEDEDHPGQ